MYLSESELPQSHASISDSAPQPTSDPTGSEVPLPLAARVINSKSLFGESRIIHIEHRGMIYRMSITNQNRLILQK